MERGEESTASCIQVDDANRVVTIHRMARRRDIYR